MSGNKQRAVAITIIILAAVLGGSYNLYYRIYTPYNRKLSEDVTSRFQSRLKSSRVRVIDSYMYRGCWPHAWLDIKECGPIPGAKYLAVEPSLLPEIIQYEKISSGDNKLSREYESGRDYWIEIDMDGKASVYFAPGQSTYPEERDRIIKGVDKLLQLIEEKKSREQSLTDSWK